MKQPAGSPATPFTRASLAAFTLGAASILFLGSTGSTIAAVTPVFTDATLDALIGSATPGASDVSQGDVLYKLSFLESLKSGSTSAPGNPAATPVDIPVWLNGIVPYTFAASVTDTQKAQFLAAAAEWSAVADITFVARTAQANFIEVRAGDLNQSHLGRQNGKQVLSLFNWDHKFIIVHQLGHALGLCHEDQRSDRDTFVSIITANIQPGKSGAFAKGNTANLGTAYDYDSLMHQGRAAYSANGLDTIVPNESNAAKIDTIGQTSYLSTGDVAGIQELYGVKSTGAISNLSSLSLSLSRGINSIITQKDGKIIVAGQFTAGGSSGTGKNHIFRVNEDGTTDSSFAPAVNSSFAPNGGIASAVVLPDDRIAITGGFLTINTVAKPFAAILNTDGTLDTDFSAASTPAAGNTTDPLPRVQAAQTDGKILVAYSKPGAEVTLRRLTTVNTAVSPAASNSGIADTAFAGPVFKLTGDSTAASVDAVLIQPDGKILVAGSFTSVEITTTTVVPGVSPAPDTTTSTTATTPCNGLIRLLSTGAVDTTFQPPALFGARCLALQPDGKILVGTAAGTDAIAPGITRIGTDGSIDATFEAAIAGTDAGLTGINLQADGKIIITGIFNTVNGTARAFAARLGSNGGLDASFAPSVDGAIRSASLKADGSLLFGSYGSLSARIANDPATSQLYPTAIRGTDNSGVIRWNPGGASPEARDVTFSVSLDDGTSWVDLGSATHGEDGWEISGLDIPRTGILRVNASKLGSSAHAGGEGGPLTEIANKYILDGAPALVVKKNGGGNLTNTDIVSIGSAGLGTSASATFTLQNSGLDGLTDIALSLSGKDASEFSVTKSPGTTLDGGASTTFTITFKPSSAKAKTANLRIASNDPLNAPFSLALTGTGTPVPEIAVEQPVKKDLIDGKAEVAFARTLVGRAGSAKTFTIRNLGGAPLKNIAINKTGNNTKDFIILASKKSTILPGEKLTFRVIFKPTAQGDRTAAIRIASNDADESPFDIKLSGRGAKGGHKQDDGKKKSAGE